MDRKRFYNLISNFNRYGEYPCIDYLNNALRYLLEDEKPNVNAINEIVYCIKKAKGRIYADVSKKLNELLGEGERE